MTPKQKIPGALRQQVWIAYCGRVFSHKCTIRWCENEINAFAFECGHNIPESMGGTIDIGNLRPICGNCNRSMGDNYTIEEWNKVSVRRLTLRSKIYRYCCGW
jgi:hypothetical protein